MMGAAHEGATHHMRTREATPEDSAALARVQVDSYRTAYKNLLPDEYLAQFTYEEQEQDWRDLMASPTGDILLVAENDSEILGYALGRRLPDASTYAGELVALHVRAPHQREGAGTALVSAMAHRLASEGCKSLILWVLEGNSARQFYEKLGGMPAGTQTIELGDNISTTEVGYGWPDITALFR